MDIEGNNLYEKAGQDLGRMVAEKNAAYGDSFNRAHRILEVLYPNGVEVNQYKDMLAIIRVIDKLFRIATDRDALGEVPWKDIAGYALLSLVSRKPESE